MNPWAPRVDRIRSSAAGIDHPWIVADIRVPVVDAAAVVEGGEGDDAVVGDSDDDDEDTEDHMVCLCVILKLSAIVHRCHR